MIRAMRIFSASLVLCATNAWAAMPIRPVNNVISDHVIACSVDVIRDKGAKLHLEDVVYRKAAHQWRPFNLNDSGLGFTTDQFWWRIKCVNEGGRDLERFLEIGYEVMDRVDVYDPDLSAFPIYQLGDQFPDGHRPVVHRNPVIPITVPAKSSQSLYLSVRTDGSVQLPLTMWEPRAFYGHSEREYLSLGLYYGIILVVFLYNLSLFLSLWDRVFLFYILYVGSHGIIQFCLNGLGFQFLGKIGGEFANTGLALFMIGAQGFIVLFARQYLRANLISQWLDRALLYFGLFILVCSPLTLALPYSITSKMGSITGIVTALAMVAAGLYSSVRRSVPGQIFLSAWIVYLIGIIVLGLKNLGVLAPSVFTNHAIQIGSALELILLSIGMGYRLKEAETARNEALSQSRVHETIANTARMLAHDVRRPFSLLQVGLDLLSANSVNGQGMLGKIQLTTLRNQVGQAFNQVNNLIADIMEFGRDNVANNFTSADIRNVMKKAVQSVFQYQQEGISINYLYRHTSSVKCDENKILRVVQNLIDNARLATGPSGHIWCQTEDDGDMIKIVIGNANSYIPREQQAIVFEPFFTQGNHRGTGLGLAIARQIVQSHGGSISCSSSETSGTEFTFTLPKSKDLPKLMVHSERTPIRLAEVEKFFEHLSDSPLQALIIDDDFEYANHVEDLIKAISPSARLMNVRSADAALTALRTGKPDVVICDLNLGGRGPEGVQLAEKFRACGFTGRFFLHTNDIVSLHRNDGKSISAVLPKPFHAGMWSKIVGCNQGGSSRPPQHSPIDRTASLS